MAAPPWVDKWADYYRPLNVSGAANETLSGLTFTPGATIVVTDNGAPFVGFPTAAYYQGLLHVAYRKATTHGIDLNGRIVTKSTADLSGLTGWSAESTLIDTPGIDDRDPVFYFDALGVMHVGYHEHTLTVKQAFSVPFAGGTKLNVADMPLANNCRDSTGRPIGYDLGTRFATYGGPLGSVVKAMLGFIGPRSPKPGTRIWLTNGTRWLYEPFTIRTGASQLITVMRTSSNGTDHQFSFATISNDNGITWSDFQQFTWVGDAPNAIEYNPGQYIFGIREIDGVTRYTSLTWTVDGSNWAPMTRIYTHSTSDASYPSIVKRADGSLIVFHYEPRFIRMTEVAVS